MKKVKQIEQMFPLLQGRRIKIYTGMTVPWAVATVTGWSGMYLALENVEIWNGDVRAKDSIHARSIDKIEFTDQNTTQ